MVDYIKQHLGPVLFAVALFFVGFFLGLTNKPDEDGKYINLTSPAGNFSIGKPMLKLADMDLTKINEADSLVLVDKIRHLSVTDGIGKELREMVKQSEGPFNKDIVQLKLHLIADEAEKRAAGPVAMACRNDTSIFAYPVQAVGLVGDDAGGSSEIRTMMTLHPVWPVSGHLSDCSPDASDGYDV